MEKSNVLEIISDVIAVRKGIIAFPGVIDTMHKEAVPPKKSLLLRFRENRAIYATESYHYPPRL